MNLKDPSWIRQVRAVTMPHLGGQPGDLDAAARFLDSAIDHQHGSDFEELGQRAVVAKQERVLQQRLELFRRPPSRKCDHART